MIGDESKDDLSNSRTRGGLTDSESGSAEGKARGKYEQLEAEKETSSEITLPWREGKSRSGG
jgi:hypothetical protein